MRQHPIVYSVVAITAVVALSAMHGVSGHGGLELNSSAMTSMAASLMPLDGHDGLDSHHQGTDHRDGGPCNCPHDTGAMCALIVLAVIVATRRMNLSSRVQPLRAWRPAVPTWSPEPPVPRSHLLVAVT